MPAQLWEIIVFQVCPIPTEQLAKIMHNIYETSKIPMESRNLYEDVIAQCILPEILLEICQKYWSEDLEDLTIYFKTASIKTLTTKTPKKPARSDEDLEDYNNNDNILDDTDNEIDLGLDEGITDYGRKLLMKYR